MTLPRRVLPGTTYFVSRRCVDQRFFLKPCVGTNFLLEYLLAHYTKAHGIELYGYVFMSNHLHLVFHDPEGKLPVFMREFSARVTIALNRLYGRRGRLWESSPYTAVPIATQEDLVRALAYTTANPVAAGGVPCPRLWPGAKSGPWSREYHEPRRLEFPQDGFAGEGGRTTLPKAVELRLHVPQGWGFTSNAEFFRAYQAALAPLIHQAYRDVKRFQGVAKIERLKPTAQPREIDRARQRNRRPHLTNATPEDRIDLVAWRRAYREAFELWRTDKSVAFPEGTYLHVQVYGAKVAGEPPPT